MIYIYILVIIFILTIFIDIYDVKINKSLLIIWLWIIFVALSACRYRVGGDTLGYMDSYSEIPTLDRLTLNYIVNHEYQPFWLILCSISKTISSDFALFQLIHALIVNTLIFRFIIKQTSYIFTALLFYYFFFYLYFNMEILRESIAIGIFLNSIPFIEKKKWLYYYLCTFLGTMFHLSAIITMLVPILYSKSFKYYIPLFFIFTFVLFFFSDQILLFIIQNVPFEKLKWLIETYSKPKINLNGIIFVLLSSIFIPLFIFIMAKKNHFSNKWYPFVLIYIMLSLISIFWHPFYRLVNYVYPIYIIFVVEIVIGLIKKIKLKYVSLAFIVVFFMVIPQLYYITRDKSDYVPNTRHLNIWYPYYSIFNKQIDENRELLVPKYYK